MRSDTGETARTYADAFFRRHPKLREFAPEKIIDGAGGYSGEARQHLDEIQLYSKFWRLDADVREFVFTHEIGHYVLSLYGLANLITDLEDQGIDPWNSSSLPFGQYNMDEAFADSFATYFLNRSELKARYPKWYAVMHSIVA
jgi:hypothetical protein